MAVLVNDESRVRSFTETLWFRIPSGQKFFAFISFSQFCIFFWTKNLFWKGCVFFSQKVLSNYTLHFCLDNFTTFAESSNWYKGFEFFVFFRNWGKLRRLKLNFVFFLRLIATSFTTSTFCGWNWRCWNQQEMFIFAKKIEKYPNFNVRR